MGALTILICALTLVITAVMVFRLHAFMALIAAAILVTQLTSYQDVFLSEVEMTSARVLEAENEQVVLQRPPKWKKEWTSFAVLPQGSSITRELSLEEVTLTPDESSIGVYLMESKSPRLTLGSLLIPIDIYRHARQTANQTGIARVAEAFGKMAMKIGILIAMASVLGKCLLASGAARVIVERIRHLCGESNTPIAFVISSFILAIPLYFDTVFLLMLPLAKAMHLQTGRDYIKYVLSIVVGGTLAHSLVPPTPGPLLIAAELEISLPLMFVMGVGIGSMGILAGYVYLLWANRHLNIPMRDVETISVEKSPVDVHPPGFGISVLPILLPVVFLGVDFLWPALLSQFPGRIPPSLTEVVMFLGDKNIALTISAFVAFFTLWAMPSISSATSSQQIQAGLSDGGTVLLITCAGGALGETIQQTNISSALIHAFPTIQSGTGLLIAAFLVTTLIRVAQGSATVAMITTVGIFAPLASVMTLPFHPVYLAMAIGCGSKPLPWMNDSGFWVIGKMSGFTEKETFQTFSILLTIMGLAAFGATLIAAQILPLK